MAETHLKNRRIVQIENPYLQLSATIEGGHLAEIRHKPSGVNPLWTPPWPSIEPSAYSYASHPEYGSGPDAPLLAGILGHNLCLDTFGSPSPGELAAGHPIHGEGSLVAYEAATDSALTLRALLPLAQLRFTRRIELASNSPVVLISETVENLSAIDRPIAWTQHVTLGPPFLESGKTQFRIPATRSKVGDASFNDNLGPYVPDAEFTWPFCPLKNGAAEDLRVYTKGPVSGGFTTHLLDPKQEHSFFLAWSPSTKVLFGYIWKQKDFPWLARWEEHHLRATPPWNGKTLTCGMEFGVSPFTGSRREMVERSPLFGTPGYCWAPALGKLYVEYCAFITTADSIPETVRWNNAFDIEFT